MRKSHSTPILLLIYLLISFDSPYASPTPQYSSLKKGSSLSVEDESDLLFSPDKSFTCGFYKVGTNAYSFSIWFSNSANKTIVWTANWGGRLVNGHGSRFSVHWDGNMVLTDVDGSTVWNANTISTNVDRAELLNSGNLVLKDPNGRILWQSFDSPTNTLLPSQTLTKGKRLVSAIRKGELSSGYFILFFDSENVLRLMYDGPDISRLYWPNPDFDAWGNGRSTFNSSRSAVLDNKGEFSSSDQLKLYASDLGVGIRRRLTLDYDGNLRLYSLNESTGLWLISWVALPQQCNIHGLCGRYGVCVYTPMPKCTCLQGYEMNDLGDWSKGCKPKFSKICNTQMVKFVELPQTDFFGFDLNYSTGISLESCKKICLDDCSCEAFQYRLEGDGRCWAKSALFNGRNSPNLYGTIYLKLPKSLETENSSQFKGLELVCSLNESEVFVGSSDVYKESTGTEYRLFLWFALSVGGIEILFIAAGWWYIFKEHGMQMLVEEGYRRISNQFKRFTYVELKKATDQFKDELGRGGSGSVYKGVLADKRAVAVKKLRDVFQCEEEFWAEVSTIGRINHMNLVRMWGYCSEKAHRLLVSEYVENGSLDKYLFSDGSSKEPARLLGWNERFKIAVGTAKGLAYLHHQCLEWVIHCDVKPENILLGCDFEPKIADFGLAKLSQRGGPGSNFSRVRGTKGYMAPEWTLNLPITAKVDVYSYGIVLLEIVKGSRFLNWMTDAEEEVGLKSYARMAKEKMESGEESWVGNLVDSRLDGKFDWKQAAVMVEIGLSCVEEERSKRPTMDMIVRALHECQDEERSTDGSFPQTMENFYSAKTVFDSYVSV
ncbi:putative receptor protein kinase ZmPK1 [Magnolia sinica]|uniref:putative receptor protein kinase ZmPK1 n=1 Tax=Magnolia sinica TaxID=86752 RepID=UPI002659C7A5|nr:putative receptor protein kinase ZmPK1 [Magnolia sinica]